jgi:hypothetical protein
MASKLEGLAMKALEAEEATDKQLLTGFVSTHSTPC